MKSTRSRDKLSISKRIAILRLTLLILNHILNLKSIFTVLIPKKNQMPNYEKFLKFSTSELDGIDIPSPK